MTFNSHNIYIYIVELRLIIYPYLNLRWFSIFFACFRDGCFMVPFWADSPCSLKTGWTMVILIFIIIIILIIIIYKYYLDLSSWKISLKIEQIMANFSKRCLWGTYVQSYFLQLKMNSSRIKTEQFIDNKMF